MRLDPARLGEVPLFQLIDDRERETLASLLELEQYGIGQFVFHQGDPGSTMYVVESGRVQVFTMNDAGERIVLGENGPGDVFGEISLLDGGARTASAMSCEPTLVLAFSRERLLDLVGKHPHVALDLLTIMGRRLRETDHIVRTQVAWNVNDEADDRLIVGQRVADRVAAFGGSWTFIIAFGGFLVSWVVLNTVLLATRPVDPFPYILLNLFLSMIAALQAPIIR